MLPFKSSERDGVTRRGLLKVGGAGAAAMMLHGVASAEDAPASSGAGARDIVLQINGASRTVQIEPRTTLADALRLRLDLTGTKIVCDRGACSACTVFLDSMPVCSCMTLAIDVGDRAITTIEGLAQGGELHPVQQCFIERDAMQCGFCTPGMVMSCAALLARNAAPSLDDVKQATSGNLCRCGTYPHVFAATLDAAKRMGGGR